MNIRTEMQQLLEEKNNVNSRVEALQKGCNHTTSVYRADGSSGNWDDPEGYYWYDFFCYDCLKRWSHDQKLGYGKSLKVDKIDYNAKPEVIELKLKIRDLER